jgi:1-acyl-sn-glycerol-3-phosphate acyltransferase
MTQDHGLFRWIRSVWRVLVLIFSSFQAALMFVARCARGPLTTAKRAEWLHDSCRLALHRLRIEIVSDPFPARGLLVSNHLSYLDILVFSAISPCVFVSKKEVRSWPLYGWLAKMAGTVFVDRKSSADAQQATLGMAQALAEGTVVVLFPEGTTSDGSGLLPFHAALFEAAITSREPVAAARINYSVVHGSVKNDVYYWGEMKLFPHLLRLMSLRGLQARVRFAPEPQRFEDRKVAAQATRDVILALGGGP